MKISKAVYKYFLMGFLVAVPQGCVSGPMLADLLQVMTSGASDNA